MQLSKGHVVLLFPYRPMAWQMSIHIDTCSRISPFSSLTCSEVGPMSLGWSQEDANGEHPGNAHTLQAPEVQRDRLNRNTCVHIPDGGLRCIGSPASSQLSRERKHVYLTRLAQNNDIICLQETHGKDEFQQALQVLVPQFQLFWHIQTN